MNRLRTAIIAHRGASHDAPENTVAAFRLAWEQGADACELDIHQTRDGRIVAIHDPDTKRTTGLARRVADLTLAELRTLDAGRWKSPAFAGEPIPTLGEMLATTPPSGRVFIEVKCPQSVVPELLTVLRASNLEPERTPILCFDARVVVAVKQRRPELPACWLVDLAREKPPDVPALIASARSLGADGIDVSDSPDIDTAFVTAIHAAGLRLDVWTINDPAEARRLVALGVDGITTDRPGWLREQLAIIDIERTVPCRNIVSS
jgi:glycerophosphoryl diester phosphodiesterase